MKIEHFIITEVKILPQMIPTQPIKNMTTKLNVTQAVAFLIPIHVS